MTRRRDLLALPLAALVPRCAAPPPPPPPPVLTLVMHGSADQNADALGRGTSVAVQVFYLTATAKFERGDVFALTEREKETLGQDSAGSEQFILGPGEERTVTRDLKPGVQAIGVAVLFRNVDHGAKWRLVAPVASSGPTRLVLQVSRDAVTLGSPHSGAG